jgi:hydrogenase/urease accessory protein HupE
MSMVRVLCWCLATLAFFSGGAAWSHESMPASLLLREIAEDQFEVVWRVPQTQGAAPAIEPVFPDDCSALTQPMEPRAAVSAGAGAKVLQWTLQCDKALRSATQIAFAGLPLTLIDVLVRVSYLDGQSEEQVARPRTPAVVLSASRAQGLEVPAYFGLGVEHILGGIDHLLFVLCLILLVPSLAGLLKTITAFTLAHSLTLALSALDVVHVAQPPVEATIALSILFLARELARKDIRDGIAVRRPWAVAFVFGLLHGFGFAGALAEIGLPQGAIPSALFLFNLGIETGQLVFVALVYPAVLLARHWRPLWPRWATPLPVYCVGAVAGFWWLQRMGPVLGLQLA